jgi:CubicO group peptidase (beta-lactamase class C family)
VDLEMFTAVTSEMEHTPALRMKSLIVTGPGTHFSYDFGRPRTPADLRSISKLVVALTLGVAVNENIKLRGERLSLDTKVAPFFAEFTRGLDAESQKNFGEARVRHLLSNTLGHQDGFLFRKDVQGQDPESLLTYIFSRPIKYAPGTHFSYSNVGWYLLSAMVKDQLGVSLSQWVAAQLFTKLGITEFTWTKYGPYEAAATGLALVSEDAHKLGELLLADGVHNQAQLVPRAWIDTIRGPVVAATSGYDRSSPLQATAYGYGIWVCGDGTYYCDGSGGQFVIVVPRERLVISAFTEEGDTLSVSRCLRQVLQG